MQLVEVAKMPFCYFWRKVQVFLWPPTKRDVLHCIMRQPVGYKEIILILLERGLKIDAVDEGGFSALHFTAFHSHSDALALLLEGGAKRPRLCTLALGSLERALGHRAVAP